MVGNSNKLRLYLRGTVDVQWKYADLQQMKDENTEEEEQHIIIYLCSTEMQPFYSDRVKSVKAEGSGKAFDLTFTIIVENIWRESCKARLFPSLLVNW